MESLKWMDVDHPNESGHEVTARHIIWPALRVRSPWKSVTLQSSTSSWRESESGRICPLKLALWAEDHRKCHWKWMPTFKHDTKLVKYIPPNMLLINVNYILIEPIHIATLPTTLGILFSAPDVASNSCSTRARNRSATICACKETGVEFVPPSIPSWHEIGIWPTKTETRQQDK